MNPDTFNMSIRKFLKMVGVSSQREIEQAVQRAMASGAVRGSETLPATMRRTPSETPARPRHVASLRTPSWARRAVCTSSWPTCSRWCGSNRAS